MTDEREKYPPRLDEKMASFVGLGIGVDELVDELDSMSEQERQNLVQAGARRFVRIMLELSPNASLAEKQARVRSSCKAMLDLIAAFKDKDKLIAEEGYPPTVDELARHFATEDALTLAQNLGALDFTAGAMILRQRALGYFDSWMPEPGPIRAGDERWCPVCRRLFDAHEGRMSVNGSDVHYGHDLCRSCSDSEISYAQLIYAEKAMGDVVETELFDYMIANSSQMRRLCGTSHALALGYGIDFRLDTVLDQGGLHLLRFLRITTEFVIEAEVSLKVAFLTNDEPIENVGLSIRLCDWLMLQPPGGYDIARQDVRKLVFEVPWRQMIPDEYSPERADPSQPTINSVSIRRGDG